MPLSKNIAGDASLDEKPEPLTATSLSDSPQKHPSSNNADVADMKDSHDGFEPQYLTGIKLVLIVASVALACFLMLVDTIIISTVSHHAAVTQINAVFSLFASV